MLAVRAGSRAGAEDRRQRLALLGVDHDGEGLAVGLLAQVPAGRPGELVVAGDVAGIRHARQAEVGGVRQHRGEHDAGVVGQQAGAQVGEGCAEAVQRSTSASRSVMRTAGTMPYSRSARVSACSGVAALSGEILIAPP